MLHQWHYPERSVVWGKIYVGKRAEALCVNLTFLISRGAIEAAVFKILVSVPASHARKARQNCLQWRRQSQRGYNGGVIQMKVRFRVVSILKHRQVEPPSTDQKRCTRDCGLQCLWQCTHLPWQNCLFKSCQDWGKQNLREFDIDVMTLLRV